MNAETDAKLIEQGRKLFAGEWQFVWASPSIETLPPMASVEVSFAGRSNVGKSSLINALTGHCLRPVCKQNRLYPRERRHFPDFRRAIV